MEAHQRSAFVVSPSPIGTNDDLGRQMNKLAAERASLFEKAGVAFGLSAADHLRLKAVELELDECFLARRQARAVTDARRFDRESLVTRRVLPSADRRDR